MYCYISSSIRPFRFAYVSLPIKLDELGHSDVNEFLFPFSDIIIC